MQGASPADAKVGRRRSFSSYGKCGILFTKAWRHRRIRLRPWFMVFYMAGGGRLAYERFSAFEEAQIKME